MAIDALPDELLAACFAALSAHSLTRAARVCTRWRDVASRDELWRALAIARWPSTTSLNIVNHRKFYKQRAQRQRPWQRSDYTLILDGTLNGGAFSLALPFSSATAEGSLLTWACAELVWQDGTLPHIDLKDLTLWREKSQQLVQLHYGSTAFGTASLSFYEDENVESLRDGSIKPYHLVWSDHESREDECFAWRLRYTNGELMFSLVGCNFGLGDLPGEIGLSDSRAQDEDELRHFFAPVRDEEAFLHYVSHVFC